MNVVDLEYVSKAADAGAFSKAATILKMNPSTLSRRVAHLEDELGLTLFERGHFGVRLTSGGKAVMRHVRRALGELDAIRSVGHLNGLADAGEVRIGVRIPPIGQPMLGLLIAWRAHHPNVALTIFEMSDRGIPAAMEAHLVDVAFVPSFIVWPRASVLPVYKERLVVALPANHRLTAYNVLHWAQLAEETILVQGWNDSQAAREFYASLLGRGAHFQTHPASKQSVLALVAAGSGVTLAVASQSQVSFPNLVFKPVDEPNAWLGIGLMWLPETEDAAVGSFIAFMRDEVKSHDLF